jgi:protein dithiol oxidoreductase (disulfide-forming)
MKKLLFVLAAAAALAACGQKSEPAAQSPAATPEAPPPAAEAAPGPAPTNAELDRAATATQESSDAAAAPADASLERAVAMPESAQLPGGKWKAGVHYRPLVPAQPTSVSAGEVEVIEFMWLACGACYQLNERVTAWKGKQPAWLKFRQEHVMWGPSHRNLGKLLYTLDALGRSDLVGKAFEEIHRKNNMLVESTDAKTAEKQLAFAKANGISEADFKREYNGFAVATRLQRAEELTRRYRVEQTPVFIVNGKYYTDTTMAGGGADLMQLINDLAASEKR